MAQNASSTPQVAAAAGAATPSATQLLERGRPLLLEAQRLFAAGEPAASIPLLERAYQLGRWPGCLLNLAMAHHALSHCPEALDHYQRYLSADPYTERRSEVAAALNELTELCGVAAAAEPGTSAEPQTSADAQQPSASLLPAPELPMTVSPLTISPLAGSPHTAPHTQPAFQQPAFQQPASDFAPPVAAREPSSRTLEWSLVGTGLASGVAALGFALASHRKQLEASRFETFSADDPRARDVHDAGVRYNRLSWGLGISSLALLGSGTALWLWTPGDGSLAADEAVAGLQYRGQF